MKKIFAMVLALAMILSCAACGGSSKSKGDLLDEIKAQGYIELCTEPYFAPYEFVDPSKTGDAQYVGVDIEIAKYIAEKIGVELRIVPLDFTAVLAGIADGKYDIAISAIAYCRPSLGMLVINALAASDYVLIPVQADYLAAEASRAEAMRLSNVYKNSSGGYGFLTRTEEVDKYNSVEDLKDAVVITQSGSVQEALYNQNVKACKEFKLVANMTDGYLAVAEGKADVCICSTESAQLYAEANGGLAIPDFRFEVDPNMNGTVVAMPLEGSESLLEVVNEAIAELNAQGKIDQWNEEYTAYAAQLGIS